MAELPDRFPGRWSYCTFDALPVLATVEYRVMGFGFPACSV